MKIALPIWQDQVSNVFDFACILLLIEKDSDKEIGRQTFPLYGRSGLEKAAMVKHLGATVLICGAISRPAAEWVVNSGIQIVPFITGSIEQVLDAFQDGCLDKPQFALPGCCRVHRECMPGRRGRRHGHRCHHDINQTE